MESSQFPFSTPSPVQKLTALPELDLYIKRDDLIHPIVSGNKWRKLKGFFDELPQGQAVLTFGGPHSNHLPAAAFSAKFLGHPIIGIVRGEELNATSNANLAYCQSQGMKLHFISRSDYRELRNMGWQISSAQKELWEATYARILPEGGAGSHAIHGCGEIWKELAEEPDHMVLASGTGTTVQGILHAMPENSKTHVHVVSAVKGAQRECAAVQATAQSKGIDLHWEDDLHFGGFGKWTPELLALRAKFESATGIPIDPNYNAKVLAYLHRQQLPGKVLWLHTGGVTF
jgi:1-aminocyclopropane-1-carboxylate deaminase